MPKKAKNLKTNSTVEAGPDTTLGGFISEVRKVKGLSLAAVSERAGISAAYQKKLENDEVKQPSPNILHSESEVLEVPYTTLMQLAGYVIPDSSTSKVASGLDHALSSADLSPEERKAVAAFMAHLRQQRE